jgi:hypothetical protein
VGDVADGRILTNRSDGILGDDWFPHVTNSNKRTVCLQNLDFAARRRRNRTRIERLKQKLATCKGGCSHRCYRW